MKTPTEELKSPYLDGEFEFVVPTYRLSGSLAHAIDESPIVNALGLPGTTTSQSRQRSLEPLELETLGPDEPVAETRTGKETEYEADDQPYDHDVLEEGELYTDEVLAEIEAFAEEQQDPNQPATEEQWEEFIEKCYEIVSSTRTPPAIGFEFDLNYGASTVRPPLAPDDPGFNGSVYVLEGRNITAHRINANGFRLEGDGNRIEIATKAFNLTDAGRSDLEKVMKDVLDLVSKIEKECSHTKQDTSLGYPPGQARPSISHRDSWRVV